MCQVMRLMMFVSIIPSCLCFIERGQVRGRPTRLAQDSRGFLVFFGNFGRLSCRNHQGMPKSRGHRGFDGEGTGRQAEGTARNNPGRRTTGSITRWCVPFAYGVTFHALLSLNIASSEKRCGRDRWNVRRDAVGFQVPS